MRAKPALQSPLRHGPSCSRDRRPGRLRSRTRRRRRSPVPRPTVFRFEDHTAAALAKTLRRATTVFADRQLWRRLTTTGMRQDWSWTHSAREYVSLYETDGGRKTELRWQISDCRLRSENGRINFAFHYRQSDILKQRCSYAFHPRRFPLADRSGSPALPRLCGW